MQTWTGNCYYDCSELAECMHTAAPVVHRSVSQGTWYRIPLPQWTSVQLLFDGVPSTCEEVNCQASASSRLSAGEIDSQCSDTSESRDLSLERTPTSRRLACTST